MKLIKLTREVPLLSASGIFPAPSKQNKAIHIACTTSTSELGLFAHLLAKFQNVTRCRRSQNHGPSHCIQIFCLSFAMS
jgi:ABC-type tungstate transport system permease subunit